MNAAAWESYLTAADLARIDEIDAERNALTAERRRIHDRARKRARRAQADQDSQAAGLPLHLIACSAAKADTSCAARDLYQGDLFKKARAYAEAIGAPWAVLSAKHGLLMPDDQVAPYNEKMADKSKADRAAWASIVTDQLAQAGAREIVFLAGRDYRDPLEKLPRFRQIIAKHSAPLAGLAIGKQKQRLAEMLDQA